MRAYARQEASATRIVELADRGDVGRRACVGEWDTKPGETAAEVVCDFLIDDGEEWFGVVGVAY